MKIDYEIDVLKQDFLEEAKEMLEECEQLFLGLEQNPENNNKTIDQIFRLAHTIKGSGSAAGFQQLSDFAHDFESLLSKIGAGEIQISKEIIDLLLDANDMLATFVEGLLENYGFTLDTSDFQEKISELIGKENIAANKSEIMEKYGVFSMTAKKPKSKDPKPASSQYFDVRQSLKETTILICDDEASLLTVLSTSIEKALGVRVLKAMNGRLALEEIDNSDTAISAIITDLKMPEMNGLDFIRELRKRELMMPVIFYSGYAEMEDLKEFINLGAFAFLPKPFKKDLLIFELQKALKNYETQFSIRRLAELNFNTYIKLAHWSSKMIKTDYHSSKLEEDVLANLKKIQNITYKIVNQK
ncbi:MAG: response regulator [Oligoflexales bacterium]